MQNLVALVNKWNIHVWSINIAWFQKLSWPRRVTGEYSKGKGFTLKPNFLAKSMNKNWICKSDGGSQHPPPHSQRKDIHGEGSSASCFINILDTAFLWSSKKLSLLYKTHNFTGYNKHYFPCYLYPYLVV